jgi:uncharacterized protein YycO
MIEGGTRPSPGDILLFRDPHGPGALVSLVTRSPYYHVAIAAGDGQLIEAMPNGVQLSRIASKEGEKAVVIPAPSKSAALVAFEWAKSKIGDGYDPADVLAIALERTFRNLHLNYTIGDRFTCGEFVATAFHEAGHRLFPDIDLEGVMPADFERLLREHDVR